MNMEKHISIDNWGGDVVQYQTCKAESIQYTTLGVWIDHCVQEQCLVHSNWFTKIQPLIYLSDG